MSDRYIITVDIRVCERVGVVQLGGDESLNKSVQTIDKVICSWKYVVNYQICKHSASGDRPV